MLSAGLKQTTEQRKNALRTERRRLHDKMKGAYDKRKETEWKSAIKRDRNANLPSPVQDNNRLNSSKRRAEMILRDSKDPDKRVSVKRIKWANETINKK